MRLSAALVALVMLVAAQPAAAERRSLETTEQPLAAAGRRLSAPLPLSKTCGVKGAHVGECLKCGTGAAKKKCVGGCKQFPMGRGFYLSAQAVCTLCADENCRTCTKAACSECVEGYKLVAGACQWAGASTAAPAITRTGTVQVPIAPRIQYLIGDGFCAEEALQMTALHYGVWIPQLWSRKLVGNSLLPSINYDSVLQALRIDYVPFQGDGYQAFVAWAKGWLLSSVPVITIAYIPTEPDLLYDHVQPLIGIRTASTAGYDPADVLILNTDVDAKTVTRKVSDFSNTRKGCKSILELGGCIPSATSLGYAVKGTTFSRAGWPLVSLTTPKNEEPTVKGQDTPAAPQTWPGTVTLKGLTVGKAYTLYKVTNHEAVPKTPAAPFNPAGAAWSQAFVATAGQQSFPVTFFSGTPAYFFAVPQS